MDSTYQSTFEIQNAYYNGWRAAHFTSNLFAFPTNGSLIHGTINALGSWHDSWVTRHLYTQLASIPDVTYLIADTAFPHSTNDVE